MHIYKKIAGWPLSSYDQIPTFPDISSEYLQSIDRCNSSDTKQNVCYFSLHYSHSLITTWQLCS